MLSDKNTVFHPINLHQEINGLTESLGTSLPYSVQLIYKMDDGVNYDLSRITPNEYAIKMVNFWDRTSSAINLDNALQDRGYKTSYKFHHTYNLLSLSTDQLLRDAYHLEYFYNCNQILSQINNKKTFSNAYLEIYTAATLAHEYARTILALNPELQLNYARRLSSPEYFGFILRFLLGVGYQFHPKDIYEFIVNHSGDPRRDNEKMQQSITNQTQFKKWCMDRYSIDTGCLVLHPDNQKKLRQILKHGGDRTIWQQIQQLFVRNK